MNDSKLWNHRYIYLLTWKRFEEVIQVLFNRILQSGYVPDSLVCIAKGGLVPGVKLAHLLNIPQLDVVYIKRNITSDLFPERTLPELYWSEITNIEKSRVLIIDDIVGSGDTMILASNVAEAYGPLSVKTASLVVNINCNRYPDFFVLEVDDWIVFPWESIAKLQITTDVQGLPIIEV
jgi:hypoxanthine phosphoribosyltransferase